MNYFMQLLLAIFAILPLISSLSNDILDLEVEELNALNSFSKLVKSIAFKNDSKGALEFQELMDDFGTDLLVGFTPIANQITENAKLNKKLGTKVSIEALNKEITTAFKKYAISFTTLWKSVKWEPFVSKYPQLGHVDKIMEAKTLQKRNSLSNVITSFYTNAISPALKAVHKALGGIGLYKTFSFVGGFLIGGMLFSYAVIAIIAVISLFNSTILHHQ